MKTSQEKARLITLIKNKKAVIGIIGLGYVGLPLALSFVESGYQTIGFDIDEKKKALLDSGLSYFQHISSERTKKARFSELLTIETAFHRARDCDALIICVPTPLGPHREPDLTYIKATLGGLEGNIRNGQIVCLESTTYPGTTEEELKPWIESQGFNIGTDIFLVFSPEREDPGNANYNTSNIPKIIGGTTAACADVGEQLYGSIIAEVVRVSSTKAAEMTKILENIHRAVNIGLVNEMKIVAHSMDIDIFEVIKAAATKPFGFTAYYPGPGLGGHCIPIDPFYLTWKAREYGLNTRFIELAGEVNSSMPEYVANKIGSALNNQRKSINGSRIIVIGVAYKKNIDDLRESPALEIINILLENGASVLCHDPYFKQLPNSRKWKDRKPEFLQTLTSELLSSVDACLICTDHDNIDYNLIKENSSCIIDARGRFKNGGSVYPA